MAFIQFPFIEVPKELREIVGTPTRGTRAYRREGTHAECAQWVEALGLYYKGDVGLSPSGVSLFVPITRAGVHKRIRDGKLTAFVFYITRREVSFLGVKRKAKQRPYILLSLSECKAWAAEMKRKRGYVDDEPQQSLMDQRKLLQPIATAEEPQNPKEAKEAIDFVDTDPKDKGKRSVKYEPLANAENRQQDMFYLVAEAMAAMASGKKAELYRQRLQKGMEWDAQEKAWKWKE
jgi:hypothetical protein